MCLSQPCMRIELKWCWWCGVRRYKNCGEVRLVHAGVQVLLSCSSTAYFAWFLMMMMMMMMMGMMAEILPANFGVSCVCREEWKGKGTAKPDRSLDIGICGMRNTTCEVVVRAHKSKNKSSQPLFVIMPYCADNRLHRHRAAIWISPTSPLI